jgi:diacylglycerol kinase
VNIVQNFKYALIGLGHILKSERNARIHLAVAVVVSIAALLLDLPATEMVAIFFAIMTVFIAEIFNTVIEKTLDLVHPDQSPKVALIKDMAAGAVLVTAVGAAIMGFVIFSPYILDLLWSR